MKNFELEIWDNRLAQATEHDEHCTKLHLAAKAELEALELELHHAPRLNSELTEQIAQAEIDGGPAPDRMMVDIAVLQAKVPLMRARVATLLKGRQNASAARNEAEWSRYRAYQKAWATYGTRALPMATNSIRSPRPDMAEFAAVTITDAWQAYLLQHSGQVPPHPEQFGKWLGRIFNLPNPQEAWPAVRAEATAWAKSQDAEGVVA